MLGIDERTDPANCAQTRSSFESGSFAPTGVQCLFDDVHDAIDTAIRAQHQLMDMSLEERGKLIEAMRVCAREHAEELAILAHEETGYGKVPHKIAKNLLAANKTPGIEDLHPTAFSGDNGLTLVETAPYGVIGAIPPSTNPTATIINNSIRLSEGGNVDWMMNTVHPRMDSLKQGWNSPSLKRSTSDCPSVVPKLAAIFSARYSDPRPEKILILWIAIGYEDF